MQKITQEEMNGERFQFGENGRAFSYALNEDRINFSKKDLLYFLGGKRVNRQNISKYRKWEWFVFFSGKNGRCISKFI